jgi:hypothetical protein
MPEEIVYEPAWVRCLGPERHCFTTEEDVEQLAQYVVPGNKFVGFSIPHGSLDKVRCRECGHQVEEVRDEQGWAARPPGERS